MSKFFLLKSSISIELNSRNPALNSCQNREFKLRDVTADTDHGPMWSRERGVMIKPIIRDFGEKFTYMWRALQNSPVLLAIVAANQPDKRPALILRNTLKVIGLGDTCVNNWRANNNPRPGSVLDLAILFGFGPTDEKILELSDTATESMNQPIDYTNNAYALLDYWQDDTAACRCWYSLAGDITAPKTHSAWLEDVLPNHRSETRSPRSARTRGLPIAVFRSAFDSVLPELEHRLPSVLYGHSCRAPKAIIEHATTFRGRFVASMAGNRTKLSRDSTSDIPVLDSSVSQFELFHGENIPYEDLQLAGFTPARTPNKGAQVLSLFDIEPPYVKSSPLALNQKSELYGGLSGRYTIDLSPMTIVELNLSFSREVVETILNEIQNQVSRFCVYSIVSRPWQGKTIALAQLTHRLTRMPGFFTMWSIEGEGTDVDIYVDGLISELFDHFQNIDFAPKHLVIVFDGVSIRTRCRAAFQLCLECRRLSTIYKTPISLLLSSRDVSALPDSSHIFHLELTETDEQNAYDKMAFDEPRIVNSSSIKLSEIFQKNPQIKRLYSNDIHSFIDFVANSLVPFENFKTRMFANIEDTAEDVKYLLCGLAVSELWDLPIPDRIALRLANNYLAKTNNTIDDMLRYSERISVISDEWDGVGLSSPYHARTLLDGAGLFKGEFINSTLSEIVFHSLEYAKENISEWLQKESEYTRHIVQRLSKRDLYIYAGLNKHSIIGRIMKDKIKEIRDILKGVDDTGILARWAGTLSACPNISPPRSRRKDIQRLPIFAFTVLDLCWRVNHEGAKKINQAEVAVGVLRATRRLVQYYPLNLAIKHLAREVVSNTKLEKIFLLEISRNEFDVERRCNEILHAYVKIVNSSPADVLGEIREQVDDEVKSAENFFRQNGDMKFDAGNLLERARSIAIVEGDRASVEERRYYLTEALRAISENPREQATWENSILKEMRMLEGYQ